jgi:uncharacterized DUF497 family protein
MTERKGRGASAPLILFEKRKSNEEPRELIIAKHGDNIHAAVITMRENRIRIISVRRARDYEVRIYERQKNDS